ncbi:SEC14-like protein 2 [Diadema antillarum]|uniref:SEC14-like protein 2 n=1 Tax=Diadema antillarum TaxID=105358 RepID=UPI003A8B7D83
MSGFPGDLSDSQREKLAKFKDNLKDVLKPDHDDVLLLKFLRARRFDLKKSEKMFRKTLEWRAENKIDTILDWFKVPEVFNTYWCGGVCGLDKEGHVIFVTPIGNIDPKGVLFSAKASDILRTYTYFLEYQLLKHREYSKKAGRYVEGSLMIFDLENMGVHHLWKPGLDLFIKAAALAEQHYPELIHRLYVIKAPKIFPVTYSLIKPFLREDTRKKIHVLGSNWKEVIMKQIDPDQLPAYWGGSMTDPDGDSKCPSIIKQGGKIPKSFYLKDREPPHTLTTHEVSRGGVIEFKYEVKHPDSVMRYEFQTDLHDIKFGVDRVDDKGKRTPIMQLEKYNSHMVPESGEIMITEPGNYIARFDNSSWTKTKKLSYWLELLEPSDVEPEFQELAEGVDDIKLDDD